MDDANSVLDVDYSTWETPNQPKPPPKRWCPTHRRLENCEPGERLRCGPAWRDQYQIEREVEAELMNPNAVILKLGEGISKLAEEIQGGERVIAEHPTRPLPPPPTQPRPQPRSNSGRGGVELP